MSVQDEEVSRHLEMSEMPIDRTTEPLYNEHRQRTTLPSHLSHLRGVVQRGKRRLERVTFSLGEPPMRHLLWCDKRKGSTLLTVSLLLLIM